MNQPPLKSKGLKNDLASWDNDQNDNKTTKQKAVEKNRKFFDSIEKEDHFGTDVRNGWKEKDKKHQKPNKRHY
eukprot:CAMPEP_0176430174 /NCGR_PEP_ID=MMETSP0127-20121128/14105_1 /TAXON_ID=938130 /ORGANISM="Platyophrya macrostoma, Strain WH" /LENGTH=72 /DNA_ID=CAMNT_0017812031 /DNA_START=219 /DNA_END=437 /DNA_ORIENTATION=-